MEDDDETVEEAEEVGVDVAEELVELEPVPPIRKEIRFLDEAHLERKRSVDKSSLSVEDNVDKNGVEEKNDTEPESSKRRLSTKTSVHVESARLRSICSILNIDAETFAIKGKENNFSFIKLGFIHK